MKRMFAAVAVLFIVAAAFAQTTTSQPAIPTINCPDVEKIIASIPADLWPKPNLRGQALIDQGTKFKAWSEKNAKGKTIKPESMKDVFRQSSNNQIAKITSASNSKIIVELVIMGANSVPQSVSIDQVSVVNNNGVSSVTIACRWLMVPPQ